MQSKRYFHREPIMHKTVYDIPAIGKKLGDKFKRRGYYRAIMLLGQFIILHDKCFKSHKLFEIWLKDFIPTIKMYQIRTITYNLNTWCNYNL